PQPAGARAGESALRARSRLEWAGRVRGPSMIRCAGNQQQHYPEMTSFLLPTERQCCGDDEAFGPHGILPRRLYGQCAAPVVTAQDVVAKPNGDPIMSPNKLTANSKAARAAKTVRNKAGVGGHKTETMPETQVARGGAPKAPSQGREIAGKQGKDEALRRSNKPSSRGSKQAGVIAM